MDREKEKLEASLSANLPNSCPDMTSGQSPGKLANSVVASSEEATARQIGGLPASGDTGNLSDNLYIPQLLALAFR